jgi:hypothetical protein
MDIERMKDRLKRLTEERREMLTSSCNQVFRFPLFYARFQPKISNRNEICEKIFPLTVNRFKSIF